MSFFVQVRKLRHTEVKQLGQSYRASERQNRGSSFFHKQDWVLHSLGAKPNPDALEATILSSPLKDRGLSPAAREEPAAVSEGGKGRAGPGFGGDGSSSFLSLPSNIRAAWTEGAEGGPQRPAVPPGRLRHCLGWPSCLLCTRMKHF